MAQRAPEASVEADPLLRFDEAQNYLRCSRATMYRLMRRGELKAHKVGNLYRFRKSDLEKCIKAA